ncbi:MAG: hypothetical protein DWQ56_00950 [Microcystis aeruginosa DA14]|uniref:Uncharacterized protein n=1 Tax=Microcystis aeruginosa DA14 TaxID=1987506 RepID=A0A3E0MJA5_MICAE|nr:MAG: hypothetical protein DWQ56_00950 [Microcystis aeruginosa DA14]
MLGSWQVATNWKVRHSSKSIIPHKYQKCYLSSQNFPLEQPIVISIKIENINPRVPKDFVGLDCIILILNPLSIGYS